MTAWLICAVVAVIAIALANRGVARLYAARYKLNS